MGVKVQEKADVVPGAKTPRTARGQRTLRKILDGAREEFGERGFSDSSIVGITQRAGVALGTFYTYFDSKEALFQALVRDMSAQVRDSVGPAFGDAEDALDGERRALEAFSNSRTIIAIYTGLSTNRSSSSRPSTANITKRPRSASPPA
jgi:AcrR family transcriptional regulator